jgi:hypothetical protein
MLYRGTDVVPRYSCCTEVHMLYLGTYVVPSYRCCTEVQMLYRGTDVVPRYRCCTEVQMLYRGTDVVPRYRCCTEVHMLARNTFVPGYNIGTPVQHLYARGTTSMPLYRLNFPVGCRYNICTQLRYKTKSFSFNFVNIFCLYRAGAGRGRVD